MTVLGAEARRRRLWAAVIAGVLWALPAAARAGDEDSCAGVGTGTLDVENCAPRPRSVLALVPDLNVLKTPTSPAFAAIGDAPDEVERPTTPTGAALGLVSGLARGLLTPGTST